jgi:branched-chain amino acid transport system permease protein
MSAAKAHLEALPRSLHVLLVLGAVALAVFPFVSTDFYAAMVARMMILAIFAMSLDLLQGVTGLVSLGHAAFFGIGGYFLSLVSSDSGTVSLWWTLPGAVLASFAQMLFYLVFDNKEISLFGVPLRLGGSDGVYINLKPDAGIVDLENRKVFYFFTLFCLVATYLFLRRLLWSPFGRVLAGIRVNEHRMRALGYGTFGYKLAAFTLAGALAGLAGYLWGAQTGFVNPELMGFHMSAHAIMMVILGGMGNFAGAIVGAFAFEFLLHEFKDLPDIGAFRAGKHWQLWMGLFIVAIVAFAPRGLLGLADRLLRGKGQRDA